VYAGWLTSSAVSLSCETVRDSRELGRFRLIVVITIRHYLRKMFGFNPNSLSSPTMLRSLSAEEDNEIDNQR